jgi:hypothetical protein
VGWVSIDEFENLFGSLDGARILVPSTRRSFLGVTVINRLLGRFAPFRTFTGRGELLLVVAHSPSDLDMLASIPDARRRFRHIAGYVIDSYFTEDFGNYTRRYDHIFSSTEEGATVVREKFGVPSSVLRQGFDCLNWASVNSNRSIDLMGFGRQPASYHHSFQRAFHVEHSNVLYLHSPIGTKSGPAVWDERPMMLKLLQNCKTSLAFNLSVDPISGRPGASNFVTNRWLESLGTGCVVLGKRPQGEMADEMLCWPHATIELPNDPVDAPGIVREVLSDRAFLTATRARNVLEMCRRHDWRFRMRVIYQHFGISLPESLKEELAALERLSDDLEQSEQPNARNSAFSGPCGNQATQN